MADNCEVIEISDDSDVEISSSSSIKRKTPSFYVDLTLCEESSVKKQKTGPYIEDFNLIRVRNWDKSEEGLTDDKLLSELSPKSLSERTHSVDQICDSKVVITPEQTVKLRKLLNSVSENIFRKNHAPEDTLDAESNGLIGDQPGLHNCQNSNNDNDASIAENQERHFFDIFSEKERTDFDMGTLQDSSDEDFSSEEENKEMVDKEVLSSSEEDIFKDDRLTPNMASISPMSDEGSVCDKTSDDFKVDSSHTPIFLNSKARERISNLLRPVARNQDRSQLKERGNHDSSVPVPAECDDDVTFSVANEYSHPSPRPPESMFTSDESSVWTHIPKPVHVEISKDLVFNEVKINDNFNDTELVSKGPRRKITKPAWRQSAGCTSRINACSDKLDNKKYEKVSTFNQFCKKLTSPGNSFSSSLSDWKKCHRVEAHFPKDHHLDILTEEFSCMHVDTVQACFEDEKDFFYHGLTLFEDMLPKYSPTSDIISLVFRKGILEADCINLISSSFKVLRTALRKSPLVFKVDWSVLYDAVNIFFQKPYELQKPVDIFRIVKLLKLVCLSYKLELHNCDIHSASSKDLKKSSLYKTLAFSSSSPNKNLVDLIKWISSCLIFEEIGPEFDQKERTSVVEEAEGKTDGGERNKKDSKKYFLWQIHHQEKGKILQSFQSLLHLAIEVSWNCEDASKFCVSHLDKTFKVLPGDKKRLLLQTMESNILRYHLVTSVLETQYDDTNTSICLPRSLSEVITYYFDAKPYRYMLTPPTTPQHGVDDVWDQEVSFQNHSPASVEEMCMLLYYSVVSYLQFSKDKSFRSLHLRIKFDTSELGHLTQEDEEELMRFDDVATILFERVLLLCEEVTPYSLQYLTWMKTLAKT